MTPMHTFPVEPMPEHTQGVPGAPLTFELRLPYTSPPVTLNERTHWSRKARNTAMIRRDTAALGCRIPELGRCEVWLTWYVNDHRRRDADNIVPTLKACCDALVLELGAVPDDTPQYMTKHMPIIQWIPKTEDTAHMILTITQTGRQAA